MDAMLSQYRVEQVQFSPVVEATLHLLLGKDSPQLHDPRGHRQAPPHGTHEIIDEDTAPQGADGPPSLA
ncbi:hypothetical protein [Actinomycetospora sp. TBRC 11914]|uniref:hypothetical protein n=1 Tax=Actinomycetospora sp. TBRC 11914 TaxID=2729387 RepID=UPI00145CF1C5|nr:hypothetical protein [Actinomycetospora sp. TBRC 11914]NMO93130.1 hypothetical protein [Actinomycetospora sp. TBRC 11914]